MERTLFAAFEGWQNRKRGAEKPGREPWMKIARDREARTARAAYHEIAGRSAKQELGKNFSPARALVMIAEKETALLYAYEMKRFSPSESQRLKKAERWNYRQPRSCKTASAAVLLTGAAHPDPTPFVLGYSIAALSGGTALSAARQWTTALTFSAIMRLVASEADTRTPPIQWWLELHHKELYTRALRAPSSVVHPLPTNIQTKMAVDFLPDFSQRVTLKNQKRVTLNGAAGGTETVKILRDIIQTVGLSHDYYEKIGRVKIGELAAKRAGCRWAPAVWIALNKKTRPVSLAGAEQRLHAYVHHGLKNLNHDVRSFGNKTIHETIHHIIRERLNPR